MKMHKKIGSLALVSRIWQFLDCMKGDFILVDALGHFLFVIIGIINVTIEKA